MSACKKDKTGGPVLFHVARLYVSHITERLISRSKRRKETVRI